MSADHEENNFITIKNDPNSEVRIDKVEVVTNNDILSFGFEAVRGYLSSSEEAAFIGLGMVDKVDSIYVYWANGVVNIINSLEINRVHHLKYSAELTNVASPKINKISFFDEILPESIGINFNHKENDYDDFENEILLPFKQSSLGPWVSVADINNDNLEDLIFSNSSGKGIKVYTQTETGFSAYNSNLDSLMISQEKGEIELVDIDKNGLIDFLVPASGNEESDSSEYYRSSIILGESKGFYKSIQLPLSSGSASKLVSIDYDNDGDLDIIECKRHVSQKYPMHAPSHLYNNEDLVFTDFTESVFADLINYGIINDILVSDFDNDGWDDIIIVGEWSDISFYKNMNGKFVKANKKFDIPNMKGLWFGIESIDLNDDSIDDYIVGNLGTNSKYKASSSKPLKVYGHDFDNNGTWDLVLSKKYKDEYVPFRGLECSSQQMPFIQEKFETYDLFAKATTDDVYGVSLDSAYLRDINILESVILFSNSDGGFDIELLPQVAQLSPILDIEILDVNSDGYNDVILCGNIYNTEVETPRLDSGRGQILLNNHDDILNAVDEENSGLNLNGNFKSIKKLFHKGSNSNVLIATENNGPPRIFVLKQNQF